MPARPRHRRLPIGRSGGRAGQARRWAGSPRSCFEFELGDHRILWGTIERLTLQPCNPANPAPTAPGMRTQAAKSFLEKPWHCLVARDCAQYQECSLLIQPPGYQGGGQTNGQRIQSGNAQTLPHSFVGQRNTNRAPSQTQQALQWEVAWKSGASGTSGARGATEHRVFCAVEPTVASGPAAPGVCLIPTFSTTQTLSGLSISQRFSQLHQKTSLTTHTHSATIVFGLSKENSQHLPDVTASLHLCNPLNRPLPRP